MELAILGAAVVIALIIDRPLCAIVTELQRIRKLREYELKIKADTLPD